MLEHNQCRSLFYFSGESSALRTSHKINAAAINFLTRLITRCRTWEAVLVHCQSRGYTPRPVVKFIVAAIDPHLKEIVLDPAAGTGGFLVEAFEHLKRLSKKTEDFTKLQRGSLYGIEPKPLPYLLCQMNLLLHGLEYPEIDPGNALRFPLREIGDRERVDIIMTNPPFGGEEERGILSNFPEDKQTSETALLFLQLIMRKLRRQGAGTKGGRCGMVVPDGVLFADGVGARIKEQLIHEFNLHTIIRLPNGVFSPYTPIPTNLLFFDRGGPTKGIWYYEHPLPEGRKTYTKTKPLRYEELAPILEWWKKRTESRQAWLVPIDRVVANGYNLDVRNPSRSFEDELASTDTLVTRIVEKENEINALLKTLVENLQDHP